MRHHSANRIFGRTRRERTALLRGLAIELIEKGKITTTEAKAKELRPYVERLVTSAKVGDMNARRKVATKLGEPRSATLRKLFDEVAVAHKERNGGYTRITKLGKTAAGRDEAVIEFV